MLESGFYSDNLVKMPTLYIPNLSARLRQQACPMMRKQAIYVLTRYQKSERYIQMVEALKPLGLQLRVKPLISKLSTGMLKAPFST